MDEADILGDRIAIMVAGKVLDRLRNMGMFLLPGFCVCFVCIPCLHMYHLSVVHFGAEGYVIGYVN